MSSLPLFSIITVCYNSLPRLKMTVASVLSQKFSNYEYLIIDGLSSDGTRDFLSEISFDQVEVRYISERDAGIYDAMNKATQLAKGEYLLFLNAGDLFASDSILEELARISMRAAEIVFGDTIYAYSPDKLFLRKAKPIDSLAKGMPFCHQSVFVRRELLLEHPFNLKYKVAADYEFFCFAFSRKANFRYIPIPISIFEVGGVSDIKRVDVLEEYKRAVHSHLGPSWRREIYLNSTKFYLQITEVIKKLLPEPLVNLLVLFKNRVFHKPVLHG